MANYPALRWEALSESLVKDIYDSDQAMYPAPELTLARLKSFVDTCPELSLCLRRGPPVSPDTAATDQTVYGAIVVLPLRKPFWDTLCRRETSEHDVDAASMFPLPGDSGGDCKETTKVGLHVFHIERFPGFAEVWKKASFTELALEEISSRVARDFKSWDVVGWSALAATKQGSAVFKRLHGSEDPNTKQISCLLESPGLAGIVTRPSKL